MTEPVLKPGETAVARRVTAQHGTTLLEKLNGPLPDQSMGEITLCLICQEAWDQSPGDIPWTDVDAEGQAEYAREARRLFTAAANRMPIETLHGADGASVWLRGQE